MRLGRAPRGYTRSDDRIREEICDIMMLRGDIDAGNVVVSVKDGDVTLEGSVDDRRTKRLVEDLSEGILGVKDVTNRLKVQPMSSSADSSGSGSARDTSSSQRTSTPASRV